MRLSRVGDIKANTKFVFLNGFSVFVTGLSVFEMTGTASLNIPVDHLIIDFFVISSETFMVLSRSVLNILILSSFILRFNSELHTETDMFRFRERSVLQT